MKATTHRIVPRLGLIRDPMIVLLMDFDLGQGSVTVVVFGTAWSAYWGSMGSDLRGFLDRVSPQYIAENLIWGRRQFITSNKAVDRELKYLTEIAEELQEALRRGDLAEEGAEA